jgi:hypothetical protein
VAIVLTSTSFALAETKATPAAKTVVAQTDTEPTPTPTPNPLSVRGYFRSYYFTRQNATNNPGTQFNFSPGAKYVSNGVNQASLNNAVLLHADYQLPFTGWYVGGSYLVAQPFAGPCNTAASHAKGKPCVSQSPPNTNPDDTLPGFGLDTFPETYVGYKDKGWDAIGGDISFNQPWTPTSDSRVKAAYYQGLNIAHHFDNGLTIETGNFFGFQNRTSNNFTNQTLLTSFPAGSPGLASNIFLGNCKGAACNGIGTSGFTFFHAGLAPKESNYSVNGYFWGVHDIVSMFWGDGRYTLNQNELKPYIALQGGWENNAGQSVIGKINSQLMGIQAGVNPTKNLLITGGFDYVPWQTDTVSTAYLSSINWECSNSNFQFKSNTHTGIVVHTLPYFLPSNAGQCFTNTNGTTSVYYGGWASPYTDSYATDPIFTTQISQGMADRRAPGTSWKVAATFTTTNKRAVFIASDAWYNYGNALVGQNTNEWNLDGSYKLNPVGKGLYHGLMLRYRYAQRSQTNTICGDQGTSCPVGATIGSGYLGGLPLFKYNRAQLEYDF